MLEILDPPLREIQSKTERNFSAHTQWRIQQFPDREAPTQFCEHLRNLIKFLKKFPEAASFFHQWFFTITQKICNQFALVNLRGRLGRPLPVDFYNFYTVFSKILAK